ncbi:hypothetical protein [Aedoeadaptatus coxii]|uniref:hypothetical protein n=1 Tax=Aedoeadaptatus coxii TaxID=755172 RepID=UPI002AD2104B|nr:hypothetical protein [Peptoniphilus coxii]
MIIHNQRSLIAIHNERDREDFIDEKVKDGDVIKTIKTIDEKVEAQSEASTATVMEMSAMIDTQDQIIKEYKKAMEDMAMEMTEMIGTMQAKIAELEGAK